MLQVWQYFYLFVVLGITWSHEALRKGMKKEKAGKIGFTMNGTLEGLITCQIEEKVGGTRVLFQFFPQSLNLCIFAGLLTFPIFNVSIFDSQYTLFKEFAYGQVTGEFAN